MPIPLMIVAFSFVVLCMTSDVRARRISNLLSASAALTGVAIHAVYFGSAGVRASLTGGVVTPAVLLLPFALGGVGGGDVKMMAALGALLGPVAALGALMLGTILGGAIMIVHLARIGRLREKLVATGRMFSAAVARRSLAPLKLSASSPDAVALPYSVPLGLGAIAMIAIGSLRGGS